VRGTDKKSPQRIWIVFHKLVTLPKSSHGISIPAPEIVARALLGKLLIRNLEDKHLTARITEVEAYLGLIDPASHAARGLTHSNAILFGPSGHVYVYFIYGMHYCLNVAAHLPGEAGGVRIRALDPIDGLETMADLRGLSHNGTPKLLTGGPGRLCQALDITRNNSNGLDVTFRAAYLLHSHQSLTTTSTTKSLTRPVTINLVG
jgi:DNA-3-methyladenine glycosylase